MKSEKIRNYQNKFTLEISKRIQAKIKTQQENSNCENSKKLICNLQGKTPYELGLGCQLHTYASGLLCAIENKRKYLIVNYLQKQFSDYFNNFVTNCPQDELFNIQASVNEKKIQSLSNFSIKKLNIFFKNHPIYQMVLEILQ